MIETLYQLDSSILIWIQHIFINSMLTPIMITITTLGNSGLIWIVIAMLLVINKKTRKSGALTLVALAFSLLIVNLILKNTVARTRPYELLNQIQLLIDVQKDYSFPSGHTSSSFAAAIVMFKTLPKKFGIVSLIFATIMGFTRLYLGAHYPSDVLAGMIIGILIGIIVLKLDSLFFNKNA